MKSIRMPFKLCIPLSLSLLLLCTTQPAHSMQISTGMFGRNATTAAPRQEVRPTGKYKAKAGQSDVAATKETAVAAPTTPTRIAPGATPVVLATASSTPYREALMGSLTFHRATSPGATAGADSKDTVATTPTGPALRISAPMIPSPISTPVPSSPGRVASAVDSAATTGSATAVKTEVCDDEAAKLLSTTSQLSLGAKLLGLVWGTDIVVQMRAGTLDTSVRVHDVENRLRSSIDYKNTSDVMAIVNWLAANPAFAINRTFSVAAFNYLGSTKTEEVKQVSQALSLGESEMIVATQTIMDRIAKTTKQHSDIALSIKRAQTKARKLAVDSGAKSDVISADAAYSDDESYVRPHGIPADLEPAKLLSLTFADATKRYTVPKK